MRFPLAAVLLAAFIALLASPVGAQQNRPAPAAPYEPGLGDLMTTTVQPRHIKLWLAGREKNWAYAEFEFHDLDEAFGRVARVWPHWQSFPVKDMLISVMKEPMSALRQAIRAKDSAKFAAAYDQLTTGCNACHQAAGRSVVVIKKPETSPYPDQDFNPPKQ